MGSAGNMGISLATFLALGMVCRAGLAQAGESRYTSEAAKIRALASELAGKDWQRRTSALARLKEMVDSRTDDDMGVFSPIVEPLMSMVGWGGEARRDSLAAARLLGSIGKPAVPKLLEAIHSPEARLRWSAAEILTSMGPGRAPVPEAVIPLLSDKNAYVRRVAIQSLGRLGEKARDAAPELEHATNDSAPENRIYSHTALIRITGQSGRHVEAIASYLRYDDQYVRWLAAMMLGDCGVLARDSCPELLRCLTDPEEQLRVYAAASLGDIGADSKEVVAGLIEVLLQGGEAARSAASSLGKIGPKARDAVPALEDALKRGPGWWVAAEALGKIGGAEVVPILSNALRNGNADIRLAAARQLGRLGALSSPALPSLRGCLADERAYVRKAAAAAITKVKQAIRQSQGR